MNTVYAMLKRLVPRRVRRAIRRRVRPALYEGDYASWAEARQKSRGYDDRAITQKVIAAAQAVRDGRAAWDRDTVLFELPAANEPLLRALRHAAEAHDGRLNVVDFGGALGSTWWQHRPYLSDLKAVRWSIVEQADLVAIGQREFSADPLRFYPSLQECRHAEKPEVVLLSSVLAYLEDPHGLLAEIRALGFGHVIIDRTGFVDRGGDRLTVQHVPPTIYEASYPCWFFDRRKLVAEFGPAWRVTDEWTNPEDCDIDAQHRGLVLERIDR